MMFNVIYEARLSIFIGLVHRNLMSKHENALLCNQLKQIETIFNNLTSMRMEEFSLVFLKVVFKDEDNPCKNINVILKCQR